MDPSVLEFLHHKEGLSFDELDTMLNKRSGLLGLSGLTSDMRELLEEEAENQDRRARLAIDIFCRRVARYVGAYFVGMGGADAVVFTGGIGENSAAVRQRICADLRCLGLNLDVESNGALTMGRFGRISDGGSMLEGWVIPTNEELLIARDTFRVIEDLPRRW
jgi:acetate kinase